MRQTRQILRLRHEGVSIREIGCRMAVARSTVQETLKRAARAGLSWPLPEAVNDTVLEQRLFAGAATQLGARHRPEPDWARLALEIVKRPPGAKDFIVIRHRWGVERTFAWIMKQRRLVRDYEQLTAVTETLITIAAIATIVRRAA